MRSPAGTFWIGKDLAMYLSAKPASLLLGLALFSGSVLGVSAHSGPSLATHAAHTVAATTRQADQQDVGNQDPRCAADQANDVAEGDTGAEREDPNDRDNVQDENGPDGAQEQERTSEGSGDADDLQCGDQATDGGAGSTGAVQSPVSQARITGRVMFLRASLAQTGSTVERASAEQESATEAESTTGNDQETDGIACEQEGEHEGDNTGC